MEAIFGGVLALAVVATGGATAPIIPFVAGGAAAVNEDIGRSAQKESWEDILGGVAEVLEHFQ